MNAGVDIGCYFYSYATSVAAARREAEFVVSVLNKHKGVFTYPIAFDLEDNSQAGLGKNILTKIDHWLAQWASKPTYTGTFGIWQNSSSGKVSGISGNVDTDIAYKDYPNIIRNNKLNGFAEADQKPIAAGGSWRTFVRLGAFAPT